MPRFTISFLGPMKPTKPGGKRYEPWEFVLLQGASPVKLTYPNRDEALRARRTFLANPNTYSVPTPKLFTAIRSALDEAIANAAPAIEAQGG